MPRDGPPAASHNAAAKLLAATQNLEELSARSRARAWTFHGFALHARGAQRRLVHAAQHPSTHQVGFYDAGLFRKYLSPWGKNFFVLDQLGGQYLQREFGVRPESIVQIRMALIASASAHRRLTNARTHTSDLALRPTKPSLCSWAAFIQANSLRSCRRRGSRSEDETGSPQIRSDGGSTKALSSTISIRPAWTQVQT